MKDGNICPRGVERITSAMEVEDTAVAQQDVHSSSSKRVNSF